MTAVYTLGHSTRTASELLGLLAEVGVGVLVDVRRVPASRRYPHFSKAALAAALRDAGIEYRHEVDLGGHREPRPDSANTAWRIAAFRGYADHMATAEFEAALLRVIEARARTVAVMCAEADPSRCHRQLVADALVARGVDVRHILGQGRTSTHALNSRARLTENGRLVYPGRPRRR